MFRAHSKLTLEMHQNLQIISKTSPALTLCKNDKPFLINQLCNFRKTIPMPLPQNQEEDFMRPVAAIIDISVIALGNGLDAVAASKSTAQRSWNTKIHE